MSEEQFEDQIHETVGSSVSSDREVEAALSNINKILADSSQDWEKRVRKDINFSQTGQSLQHKDP